MLNPLLFLNFFPEGKIKVKADLSPWAKNYVRERGKVMYIEKRLGVHG